MGLRPNRTWWQEGEGDSSSDQQSLMVQIDSKIYRKTISNDLFEDGKKAEGINGVLESFVKEIQEDQEK